VLLHLSGISLAHKAVSLSKPDDISTGIGTRAVAVEPGFGMCSMIKLAGVIFLEVITANCAWPMNVLLFLVGNLLNLVRGYLQLAGAAANGL
jgi:hypothetical protein